jgi:hypothetical protein
MNPEASAGPPSSSAAGAARSDNDDLGELVRHLRGGVSGARARWNAATPFHYVVIEDFLPRLMAEEILASYPKPDIEGWDKVTYTHQKSKFTMRSGFPTPVHRFFAASATREFREVLSDITGTPALLADPDLVGGGLHQILRGGFLDVHVDYNLHPETKLHRRLNLLIYLNKDWKREYEGYLELWNWSEPRQQIEKIAPLFNRAVIFETNEVSFHGHPIPLQTPQHLTRKSLALYYYTVDRDVVAAEHNTLYQQSTGLRGYLKTARASAEAVVERVKTQGPVTLARELAAKVRRKLLGLPPANR